ncbi:MAG: TetR/AcrR family transcriptional regulator [Actinobacteria bacterium]|nr:MAG: TetR/AcrR family transcriptional regulator [Actinomycetota bacterium]
MPPTDLRRQREDQIASGALLLFKEKGFHSTSVREIAAAAGLSMGGLYEYISSKEDVLWLVYRHLISGLEEAAPDAAQSDLEHLLLDLMGGTAEHAAEVQLMYREAGSLDAGQRVLLAAAEREQAARVRAAIQRAMADGTVAVADPDLVANVLVFLTAFYPLRRWVLRHRPDLDADTVARATVDLVMRGMRTR